MSAAAERGAAPDPPDTPLPQPPQASLEGLAGFLDAHAGDILDDWTLFAASLAHDGVPLDADAARDHCPDILRTIVEALRGAETANGALDPDSSAVDPPLSTASQVHADVRRRQGFTVDAIVSEYRALRASVLAHWRRAGGGIHARDTDDLARFDEAIEQAIAEAIGLYVRQTQSATDLFIGILGHDIRNPLGTILASAEYLVRTRQLSARTAAPIFNAAARILAIVEQTVDFSRTQSQGVMPVHRVPGHLGEVLDQIVQETRIRHPDRALRYEGAPDLHGSWDGPRLAQVLSNLLGNAMAYGARDSEVTVRAWSADDEHGCFSVHNHGAPIPPSEQLRIFEPLVRGHAVITERRDRAGLGLGLYICREIVRAHDGTLAVASSPAAGTTFSVQLPRWPKQLPE